MRRRSNYGGTSPTIKKTYITKLWLRGQWRLRVVGKSPLALVSTSLLCVSGLLIVKPAATVKIPTHRQTHPRTIFPAPSALSKLNDTNKAYNYSFTLPSPDADSYNAPVLPPVHKTASGTCAKKGHRPILAATGSSAYTHAPGSIYSLAASCDPLPNPHNLATSFNAGKGCYPGIDMGNTGGPISSATGSSIIPCPKEPTYAMMSTQRPAPTYQNIYPDLSSVHHGTLDSTHPDTTRSLQSANFLPPYSTPSEAAYAKAITHCPLPANLDFAPLYPTMSHGYQDVPIDLNFPPSQLRDVTLWQKRYADDTSFEWPLYDDQVQQPNSYGYTAMH